ncbi:uncharacterized protein PHACADRAFT_189748 [Phanerochaete carnosa HHB-10118-sp]|uniref:Uncharacterized protein n=1 Tax=Phanerochaete carnosa (strain HHB-10118-sp) TaxID=650164 RepID=K5XCA3_PHACS|nr:uncharacterized protein PHACADRAFT_189748 [Phanerochaete carnosa HHB-10118-sp]EKM60622.1 hypothetical protein PHACADRAFT_189748 [Phanerochaete carnosa HHB-10118-sp]
MLGWFQKSEASRKYVDLIREASSKWANWDPPKTIQAGDFGTIDKKSGQFERAGNIYRHSKMAEMAENYPVTVQPSEELYSVHSFHARQVAARADANSGASSNANVTFSAEIKFENHRGASLVMHNLRMSIVPDEFFQEAWDDVDVPWDALDSDGEEEPEDEFSDEE